MFVCFFPLHSQALRRLEQKLDHSLQAQGQLREQLALEREMRTQDRRALDDLRTSLPEMMRTLCSGIQDQIALAQGGRDESLRAMLAAELGCMRKEMTAEVVRLASSSTTDHPSAQGISPPMRRLAHDVDNGGDAQASGSASATHALPSRPHSAPGSRKRKQHERRVATEGALPLLPCPPPCPHEHPEGVHSEPDEELLYEDESAPPFDPFSEGDGGDDAEPPHASAEAVCPRVPMGACCAAAHSPNSEASRPSPANSAASSHYTPVSVPSSAELAAPARDSSALRESRRVPPTPSLCSNLEGRFAALGADACCGPKRLLPPTHMERRGFQLDHLRRERACRHVDEAADEREGASMHM